MKFRVSDFIFFRNTFFYISIFEYFLFFFWLFRSISLGLSCPTLFNTSSWFSSSTVNYITTMHTVEELPGGKKGSRNTDYYYSSLYAPGPLSSHMVAPRTAQGLSGSTYSARKMNKRQRVNYNVKEMQQAQFMRAKIDGGNGNSTKNDSRNAEEERISEEERLMSALELKKANKRFEELSRENYNDNIKIEVPKNITHMRSLRNRKPSITVRRILNSKKTWTNYLDEIDKQELRELRALEARPTVERTKNLCTICGNISSSRCIKCGARVCCLKCMQVHQDTRCTSF